MKCMKFFAPAAIAVALFAATQAAANQLANAGFETDAVLNAAPVPGATGWTTFGPAAGTASAELSIRCCLGLARCDSRAAATLPCRERSKPFRPVQGNFGILKGTC